MKAPGSVTTLGLIAAALVQTAILGWMVWDRVSLLRTGRPIVLDVNPVDPRDLFRGEYVVLAYPMGRLRTDQVVGKDDFGTNDRIYVGMRETEGGTWQAFSIHRERPPLTGQVIFLRGRITGLTQDASCDGTCKVIHVHYGIESYFVPQGDGRQIEALRNDSRLQVAARVTADGEAAIAGLLVDGTLRYKEPLF